MTKKDIKLSHIEENKRFMFERFSLANKGADKRNGFIDYFRAGFKAGYNYHRKHYGNNSAACVNPECKANMEHRKGAHSNWCKEVQK